MERNVTPDMIEATLKGGKIERFGKNNVKLIKDYKRFTVICVGEMVGTKIRIFTIETKGSGKSKNSKEFLGHENPKDFHKL